MNEFELISEKLVHENPYYSIFDREYRLPDGGTHHFFVRKEVDTCCVLAMTSDGQFVVTKQYRVGLDKELVELAAGRLEGFDDDSAERIREELLEETGYQGELKKVGELPTSPYSTRVIHAYYALNCEKVAEQSLEANEFIDVELLSPEEMYDVLLAGQSSSCAPGLLAWEHLKRDGKM